MTKPKSEWARMPRETDTQWAYFQIFRDWAYPEGVTGPYRPRDLKAIAQEIGITPAGIYVHSQGCNWFMRGAAYDREVDEAKTDRSLSAVAKMRVQKEKVLSEWSKLLDRERTKLMALSEESTGLVLSVRDQALITDMVLKHEALLHGITPEDVEDAEVELDDLPLEELENLDRMAKQYGKRPGQGAVH